MMSASVHKKTSSSGGLFLALGCGCTDTNSVSVSNTFRARPTSTLPPASFSDTTLSPSSSSYYSEEDGAEANAARTPSFSELLRQLKAMEQTVMSWGSRAAAAPAANAMGVKREEKTRIRRRRGAERVEESVVVVKETADPLGEFRRSMLHMIVEKEIVDGAELRALLRRFLVLNSPRHHGVILRAFAEVWEEVFSGHERSPDLLRRCSHSRFPPRRH
ncbi:transcription repressor OFP7-like [Canna indica]|uniref:Transcription repressor n=1 Tax=Canna indica TaxID=4628 RepID=A0AAQ3Q894_9LILI|nr:transcription repressor OFP7-like [Canna indica]